MLNHAGEGTNAQRFLDAFNSIERTLRSRAKDSARRSGFGELVRTSNQLVATQKELLHDYAELRNVIVHTRTDRGVVIADPRHDVVVRIEEQADIIENPPLVLGALKLKPPRVLNAEHSITHFLEEVKPPHYYSQAPVAMLGSEVELITTNAVARWIAQSWEPDQGAALPDATISAILEFAEPGDRVEVRKRDLRVVDAWRIFSGEHGEPPAAILLTHSGSRKERPLGMCVRADLPEMLKALRV